MLPERKPEISVEHTDTYNRLAEALNDTEVVGFLTQQVPEFYASVAYTHPNEARGLVRDSFSVLTEAAKQPNRTQALTEAAHTVYSNIFQENDPKFWFTPIHNEYKLHGKPRKVVPFLVSHFAGSNILDIGGGSGYLAIELQEEGYSPEITDIIDYRAQESRNIPFQEMTSPLQLPYGDDKFDSAFFFEVLHHVDNGNHTALLDEARRVAKRLVIIEDVYGKLDHPLLHAAQEFEDPLPTQAYLSLSPEKQLKVLTLMDYYVNIASKGIVEMNMPFQFKTIEEWITLFKQAGLEPIDITQLGFFRNTLNRNFQAYFTLERIEE